MSERRTSPELIGALEATLRSLGISLMADIARDAGLDILEAQAELRRAEAVVEAARAEINGCDHYDTECSCAAKHEDALIAALKTYDAGADHE